MKLGPPLTVVQPVVLTLLRGGDDDHADGRGIAQHYAAGDPCAPHGAPAPRARAAGAKTVVGGGV
jgi:hypothetical protein